MKKEIKEQENKTIENLKLHETLVIIDEDFNNKRIEITKVPGGLLYTSDFPAWRLSTTTFVPFIGVNKK
jgi:hypothetical protein